MSENKQNQVWPTVDPTTVGPETKVRLAGLGYYLPSAAVSTTEVEGRMVTKPLFSLENLTGIAERRYSDGTQSSYDMALKAARNCLRNSEFDASKLDAVLFVSISRVKEGTRLQFEPSMSASLKNELGAPQALAFDISNACAGMTTGVHILDQMIRAGRIKNGIVISGEYISPIAETAMREVVKPVDRQMASLTVGDSGTAVLLEKSSDRSEGIECVEMLTVGDYADLCIGMPSETGPGISMYTQSSKLQSEALKRMPMHFTNILKKSGLFQACFDWIIPHQTSTRAIAKGIQVVSKHFGGEMEHFDERYASQDSDAIVKIVQRYGNTSSTSHFVALCEGVHSGKFKSGDRICLMVQASGITLGTVAFTMGDLKVEEDFPAVRNAAVESEAETTTVSNTKEGVPA
jgi:3-oxoacyl-[acyl-carrier-protein] synthase III